MPKNNKKPKKSSLARVSKKIVNYVKILEQENETLRNDPDSLIGKIMPQLRDAIGQNKRLSVLTACFIEAAGGSITIPKAQLESFEDKVLSIKWALPEGLEDPNTADSFVFTFNAVKAEEEPSGELNEPEIGSDTFVSTSDAVEEKPFEELDPEMNPSLLHLDKLNQ